MSSAPSIDGLIWAEYGGGAVQLGRLVGTRDGDVLRFRYVHVSADDSTSSGRCEARLEVLPDGRIRSHEDWCWESRPGAGTSIVEELPQSWTWSARDRGGPGRGSG